MDADEAFEELPPAIAEVDGQPTDGAPPTQKPDLLVRVAERAKQASIPYSWDTFEYDVPTADGEVAEVVDWYLDLELTTATGTRPFSITVNEAQDWLDSRFEKWLLLENYVAILDTSENSIEAMVRHASSSSTSSTSRITLQGLLRRFNRFAAQNDSPQKYKQASPDAKTLRIDTAGTVLTAAELSWTNPALASSVALKNQISLKIASSVPLTYSSAVSLLRSCSTALFLEIDMTHDIPLLLREFPPSGLSIGVGQKADAPTIVTIPGNSYSAEATSLYIYGRSATGLPLLQFLALYQVLEFFFPSYAREETIRRFQRRLKDPTFDPTNTKQVATLVSFLNAEAKALQYEEEQLRATLAGSTDDLEIRTFIEASSPRKSFLSEKGNLKGVSPINLQRNSNIPALTTQVATRIYQIRNRIVHAKEDGGPRGGDLLLPFGPETRLLGHDIALVKFLAQRALIQDSERASWQQ